MLTGILRHPGLALGIVVAVGSLMAVACGAQEATPTQPPTATSTPTSTAATPTPTAGSTTATATTVVAAPTATPTATPVPSRTVQPKRGGIVKDTNSADPISYDPTTTTGGADNTHNAKMYSSLIWNPDGNDLAPDAAESYSISADGKVWTFKLRPNIKFQGGYQPAHPRDGTLMTSRDVKWSLEKTMGLKGDVISPRSGWMKEFVNIDRPDNGVEIVDDLTLKIHLVQPFGGFANVLSIGYSGLLPDGVLQKDMQKRPFGSGAFRLKEFQRGARWTYERNPDYFKPGVPYLDQYQLIIMDGAAIIQAAFLTGKTDIFGGNPSPDNESVFDKRVKEGQIFLTPRDSGCRPQALNMNSTKPPFDDIRLRKAINMGIDRKAYTEVVWEGNAVPHLYLETNGIGRSAEEIMKLPGYRQPHDSDLAEARKIIKELYPNGLTLTQMVRNTSDYMRQGEFLAGNLTQLGINVTIQLLDATVIFDRAAKLDYTLWSYHFCQTTNTPEELFGGYFVTGGSRNWIGYSDPRLDAAYLDMAATSDPALRKQKALAMEQTIVDFMPSAPNPVHTTRRGAYSYVKDLPMTFSSYTWGKGELIWRSDA
ncbi:MAG: ABC transporter substrate-binding protein [Chloroflexi bacterium]|nr:ABC transporter substrate-binding protein [Chloroflexota bacterium]